LAKPLVSQRIHTNTETRHSWTEFESAIAAFF
jgi:hypothetical protein